MDGSARSRRRLLRPRNHSCRRAFGRRPHLLRQNDKLPRALWECRNAQSSARLGCKDRGPAGLSCLTYTMQTEFRAIVHSEYGAPQKVLKIANRRLKSTELGLHNPLLNIL